MDNLKLTIVSLTNTKGQTATKQITRCKRVKSASGKTWPLTQFWYLDEFPLRRKLLVGLFCFSEERAKFYLKP